MLVNSARVVKSAFTFSANNNSKKKDQKRKKMKKVRGIGVVVDSRQQHLRALEEEEIKLKKWKVENPVQKKPTKAHLFLLLHHFFVVSFSLIFFSLTP